MRLLQNLKYYMDQPLSYVRESYDAFLDRNYPVMRLDDIEVHCNHYDSPEDAILKWNERKEKIDYDHLYVKFDTILPEQAEQFAMLHQYERKVCFVPFEPRNACEMKIENRWGFDEFWKAMMANASLSGGASCNLLDIILGERILRYQI